MKPNILTLFLHYLNKMRTLTNGFGSTYENIYEKSIIKTIPYNLKKIVIDNTGKKKISHKYFNMIDPYIYIGRLFYEHNVYAFDDYFNIFEKLKENIIESILEFNKNFNNPEYLKDLITITLSYFVNFFQECLSFDFLVHGDKNYDQSSFDKFNNVRTFIFTNLDVEFNLENLKIKKNIFFSQAQKLWNKRFKELEKIKSLSDQNEINIALNKKNYYIESAKYYGHLITFGYFKSDKEEKNKMKEDLKLVKFKENNKKKQDLTIVKYEKKINSNTHVCLKNLLDLFTYFIKVLLYISHNNNIKNNNMLENKIEDIKTNVHVRIKYDENTLEESYFREVPGIADSNLNEID